MKAPRCTTALGNQRFRHAIIHWICGELYHLNFSLALCGNQSALSLAYGARRTTL
ncbi:hypothetical protein K505DRAFT_323507 [Melanomma pulvis-pyrius CBS 109.77]|uniref:Uncharacterized protein n=1 Tax=Melanomma pulvis-pyrius CBS 109.77 TaxID=1314802 RepID=A0A6A6XIG7_9PLEO|nr:hypothetical protein K505DRAFT_323507 [Melanomma pulvis-pyrius CBS 109.77]